MFETLDTHRDTVGHIGSRFRFHEFQNRFIRQRYGYGRCIPKRNRQALGQEHSGGSQWVHSATLWCGSPAAALFPVLPSPGEASSVLLRLKIPPSTFRSHTHFSPTSSLTRKHCGRRCVFVRSFQSIETKKTQISGRCAAARNLPKSLIFEGFWGI